MTDIFPPELLSADKLDEAIEFLQLLKTYPRIKKEAIIAWCKLTRVILTAEIVRRVLGNDEFRVR